MYGRACSIVYCKVLKRIRRDRLGPIVLLPQQLGPLYSPIFLAMHLNEPSHSFIEMRINLIWWILQWKYLAGKKIAHNSKELGPRTIEMYYPSASPLLTSGVWISACSDTSP